MKIFVVGSTGFIGKNLVEFYSSKGHEVFEYKRHMELLDRLNFFRPDLIINCAAEIYKKEQMFATNVELVHTCLWWITQNTSTRFVQLGSSSEYGPLDHASQESETVNPVDMYAGTKGIATMLCQTYANTYGLDIVVLRPYSPFGPGEQPHRLFPNLWKSFVLDKPMNLVQGVHDFCYIDDFVEALDLVIQSNTRTPGEIINVSSGIQTTNAQVLDLFRQITGKQGNVTIDDRFVTPPIWQANISHIKTKYRWSPKFTLEDGIKKFLERANYE